MADSAATDATKGPSKKQLNKLARQNKPAGSNENNAKYSVLFCKGASPDLTRAVELHLGEAGVVKYFINKGVDAHLPLMKSLADGDAWSVSGDENVARYLVRVSTAANAASLYGSGDAVKTSQIDQWLSVYDRSMCCASVRDTLVALVNTHVAERTFFVGSELTLADIAIWTALRRQNFTPAFETAPHTSRWFEFVTSSIAPWSAIPVSVPVPPAGSDAAAAKKGAAPPKAAAATESSAAAAADADEVGALGGCPPLEGAVEGQVCTRFPPEPSGYLHIGHAKAVLLNQYYAQHYKGRLLVRFDDTNPSKEKEEFAENILKDLETLKVKPDAVSHSSDHFRTCEDLARKMIRDGNAYMDNTDQETMQAERMQKVESKNRNNSVEENLKWFEALLKGQPEEARTYCLRAKIDMQSVNGTMRDPVLYRFNDTPHLKTGTQFCAYPTYDFVCPIVDAIEGVTHALRTTEYNDRDEQYHWIQKALGLRHVHIHSFGKMNFVHTVLSKRKLTWFVEQGLVEGWFDPRFPTIQGCVRRGVNVEALKNFIIGQGASRRVITMEWDKFWAENKKVLEETAPRYMGVTAQDRVVLTLENVPEGVTEHEVQVHPQKPEMGMRIMRRSNKVLVDQEDAASYKQGEEITLLRWGNVTITAIDKAADGKVTALRGTYDPAATNFSKTKKATWIADVPELVPVTMVEFDHIISKAKLTDEDRFQDYVNTNTRTESAGLCDPCVAGVKAGEVIQLERKGFFRCDVAYGGPDKPAVLFFIPDGRGAKKPAAPTSAAKK